jgi:D-alanyl-lipoteichoic acid acyltransferase DltB (MBOAT superfamily)
MLASGLWHGTNRTFLVWGALQDMLIIIAVLPNTWKNRWHLPLTLPSPVTAGLKIFATFNVVSFTWIFFRANTLSDAGYIATHLFASPETRSSLFAIVPGGWSSG